MIARLSPDLPTVIIAFPIHAPPFIAFSSTTGMDAKRRIVDGLSPEWRDVLQEASTLFALERPDLQDAEDWFAPVEGGQ